MDILGDQCPMYFDDGANPWRAPEDNVQVFFSGVNDYSKL